MSPDGEAHLRGLMREAVRRDRNLPVRTTPVRTDVNGVRTTYEECAAAGMTQAETAARMGVSRAAVCQYARRNFLRFRGTEPRS